MNPASIVVGGAMLLGCAWLFTSGEDEKGDRRLVHALAWVGAIVIIVALVWLADKYVWPGAHNPDDDYR